jgi:hypothetical protein
MLGSPPPENNMRDHFWPALGVSNVYMCHTRSDKTVITGLTRDDVATLLGDQAPIIAYDTGAAGVLRFPDTDEGWHLARLLCAQLTLAPHATVVAK